MREIPVVLCSAHADAAGPAGLGVRECDPRVRFVAKPFHPDVLIAELESVLAKSPSVGEDS